MASSTQRLPTQWTSLGSGPLDLQVLTGAAVVQEADRKPATDSNDGTILSAQVGAAPTRLAAGAEWWIKALVAETAASIAAVAADATVTTPSTSSSDVPIAGAALAAFTAVALAADGSLQPASSDDMGQFGFVLGILPAAAQRGEAPTIRSAGLLTNPAWSFTRGPVYLAPDATLAQAEPVRGFSQLLAVAVTPTRILVGLQPPIAL